MKKNFVLMLAIIFVIAGCVEEEKKKSRAPKGFAVKVKASKF